MIAALRGFHLLDAEQQVAIARDLEGYEVSVDLHTERMGRVVDGPLRGRLVAVAVPVAGRGRPLLIVADRRYATPRAVTTYWVRDLRPANPTPKELPIHGR